MIMGEGILYGRIPLSEKGERMKNQKVKRKKAVALFVAAALLAPVCVPWQNGTAVYAAEQATAKAELFDAGEVQLTDGMFLDSQNTGKDFLLSYDVDRLAVSLFRYSNQRGNAPVDLNNGYGGWEDSGENGLGGHSYGHYMSACAAMYQETGDARLKERVERGVELLAIAQDPDGFVGGFSRKNLDYVFDHPDTFWAGGNNDAFLQGIWAPWYTIHKLMAGLIDAYRCLGNEQALACAEKIASYAETGTD